MTDDANLKDVWDQLDAALGKKPESTPNISTSAQPQTPHIGEQSTSISPREARKLAQAMEVAAMLDRQLNGEAMRKEEAAHAAEEAEFRVRSIAQGAFHDGICEQIHNLYCLNGRPLLAADDFTHGMCNPREKCEEGVCVGEMYELKLYAVQPDREDEELLDHLRRQKTYKEMYISDTALQCAVRCGMLAGSQFMRSDMEMKRRKNKQQEMHKSKIDHSPFNVLIHACVEKFCLLSSTANKAHRDLYEKIHECRVSGANVVRYIYFCKRHVRFHICDQHCDQARAIKSGGTVCVLSANVKTGMSMKFSFEDGTGTTEQRETMADINAMRDVRDTTDAELEGFTLNPMQHVDVKQRRKAAFGGVTIIRDRTSRASAIGDVILDSDGNPTTSRGGGRGGRKRGRGRGRGSIAGGGNRQQTARREMAESLAKSSGDLDSTMTPQDEATKYAQIVSYSNGYSSNVASRDTIVGKMGMVNDAPPSSAIGVSGVAGSGSSTSRKRKVNRARRCGAAEATPAIKITLDVPRYLVNIAQIDLTEERETKRRQLIKSEVKTEVKSEPIEEFDGPFIDPEDELAAESPPVPITGIKSEYDHSLSSRLSTPGFCAYELQEQQEKTRALDEEMQRELDEFDVVVLDPEKDLVTVSCNIQPGAPFAERKQNQYDKEFVIDTLRIVKQSAERRARFRLTPQQKAQHGNTFFSTDDLFESYGERACKIIWRLLWSTERGAIERSKKLECDAHVQANIASYVSKQIKEHHLLSVEKIARIAWQEHERSSICKTLVIDLELCKILETYYALVAIEFYYNLISLPQRLCLSLDETTSDTIKKQFHFEHMLPAIMGLMREGLEVKNVQILPKDCYFIREWDPEPSTTKIMGIADQTMTGLRTAINSYIAAADRSNVSMRRFEGTRIDWQELVKLRAPGYIRGTETMDSVQRADFLANYVVVMFVKRRAKRLNSFVQFSSE